MTLQTIQQKLEQKKGARNQILRDLKISQEGIKSIEKEISYSEKSASIIAVVAKATQNELSYRIAEPVSLALQAVYGENAYQMSADFSITGKGTTECALRYKRGDNIINPLDAAGGGTIDIASFALRIGSWSLTQPRSRNTIILDEPFKFVSRDKMELAGAMLKETSKQLGLQIIFISHIAELIEAADKVLEVSIKNRISSVKEL